MDFIDILEEGFRVEGETRTLQKGELLIREGDTERSLYLVQSGLLRVFLLSEYEDQTIRFGYAGSYINSLASFIQEKPSAFYIEAMRKTTIRSLPKSVFSKLASENEENVRMYARLIEGMLVQQIEREIDLLTPSPVERLRRVLQRSPNLFQEVPLKYIASYLRMTPETLSRIRKS